MQPRGIDASDGGAGRGRAGSKRLHEAVLLAAGELGYAQMTVADLVTRAKCTVEDFEARFASLPECFQQAYAVESQLLCDRILHAAGREASWRAGLTAALRELGNYAEAKPLVAKALLIEVHVAGRDALIVRTERIERLSHALDSARRETTSRHSPPPSTALFMVSTIEDAVASALLRQKPEEFLTVVPELELLIVRAYFAE